jgi:pimeloyl-ACP methyl ester carboxylesterase
MAANRAALQIYSGPHGMQDPALRERLAEVTHPTLVAWGESDRVVDIEYGRAYAAAVPDARFTLIRGSGHMPQIETPAELLALVWEFAQAHHAAGPAGISAALAPADDPGGDTIGHRP